MASKNETNVNKLIYAQKVELLLRLVPIVMDAPSRA